MITNHFHMSILIILIINLCPPPSSSSSSSLFPLSGPLHATGYKSDLRNRRPQSEKSRWTRKLSPLDFIWTITFLGKYIVLCVQMQVCGYFIYHILQLSKKGQLRFEFRDNCQSFFAVKTLSICINKYVFDLLYKILSVKKKTLLETNTNNEDIFATFTFKNLLKHRSSSILPISDMSALAYEVNRRPSLFIKYFPHK